MLTPQYLSSLYLLSSVLSLLTSLFSISPFYNTFAHLDPANATSGVQILVYRFWCTVFAVRQYAKLDPVSATSGVHRFGCTDFGVRQYEKLDLIETNT